MGGVPDQAPATVRLRSINGREMEIVFHKGLLMVTYVSASERAKLAQLKHEMQERVLDSFKRGGSVAVPLRKNKDGNWFAELDDVAEAVKNFEQGEEDG